MSLGSSDSRVGLTLDGRYRIVRRIGVGGRGVVYEARHEEMGRSVAIKLIADTVASQRDALARFRREGRAAGRLHHPNVVVVHDFRVTEEHGAFLVMELCAGGSLADELTRDGRSTAARTAEVVRAVASAVSAAHRAGIVHRDLKPANILFSDGVVKVADFGLATLAEDDPAAGLTGHHAVGSPHYMSPEQAQGEPADARSDVYGLGVIAYEMLTGFAPFTGSSVTSILMKHLTETPRAPHAVEPSIPPEASRAILKALEKIRGDRWETADAFAEALGDALEPAAPRAGSEGRISTKPVSVTTMEMGPVEEAGPIGRDEPLSAMNARLLDALRGRGGFLFVSGEPGAGKSTLVEAFLRRELASRPEILTATGRCSEHFGAGEAYLPFLEIATQLVGRLESGRVAGFLKTMAPTWSRHLPVLARYGPPAEAEAAALPAQDRMPREFTDFLAVLGTIRPLVLVLEDLHWADAPSVDLLAYLARRIGEMRLLVVATYRRSEIEVARHPLRQALRGLSSTGSASREIAPPPFSEPEVEAYLVRELGVPVDAGVVRFVHRRTEGNPLFVVNVLKHLLSLGAIRIESGRALATRPLDELSDAVPEGITGVILSRFEGLDEDVRRLLSVASVQGETFDSAAVAAALVVDELDVEDRLDRLHRAHALVAPQGELELPDGTATSSYRFVHGFYQDALYGAIPPRRRAAWHAALGAHLAARHARNPDPVVATLAVHWERAHDAARAIAALERAAELASARSPREAEPLLTRGVKLTERLPVAERGPERARLLTRLGRYASEAAEIVGDVGLYARAEKAIEEALALDPHGLHAAEARTTLGLVHLERGKNEKALEDLRAVLHDAPGHAPAFAALAYLHKNTGQWERCLEAQARAGALDPRLAHSVPRLSVLIYQRRIAEAFAEVDALLALRPGYGHFHYWKGIVHFYAGDLPQARVLIDRGHDLDPDNFIAKGVRAFILAHQGETEEATRLLSVAEAGADADGTFTCWIAKVRAALGMAEEAVEWIGRAEKLGYWDAPWIAADPAFDPLRGRPDFEARLASVRARYEEFARLLEAAPA